MPFIPLNQEGGDLELATPQAERRGFIPLEAEPTAVAPTGPDSPQRPSVLRNLLLNNPLTAIGETALNLATQGVAVPASGLAGLATEAGRALGLTDRTGADVVHAVGQALTYQPRGEMGQAATEVVTWPFQKLAEAGQAAGGATLDQTGSPAAATAVDTAVNALPMLIAPAAKRLRGRAPEAGTPAATEAPTRGPAAPDGAPDAGTLPAVSTPEPPARGFTPLAEDAPATAARDTLTPTDRSPIDVRPETRPQRLASDDPSLLQPDQQGLEVLRRAGDPGASEVVGELRPVPAGHGAGADAQALAGTTGRAQELRTGELLLDDARGADAPPRLLQEAAPEHVRPDDRGGFARAGDLGPDAQAQGEGLRPQAARGSEPIARGAQERADPELLRPDDAAAPVGETRGHPRPAAMGSAEAWLEYRARAEHAAPSAPQPAPKAARYALIEADQLRATHDELGRPVSTFPEALRPVDAGRDSAPRRAMDISRSFDPQRLAQAADDGTGAPIVARDGVVEAGQARAIALQQIYQANGMKAMEYRAFLREQAPALGIDPAAIDGMRKPVLVRVPDAPAPRSTNPVPPVAREFLPSQPPAPDAGPRARTGPDRVDMPPAGRVESFAPGANYMGFINDAPKPGADAATAVGRRSKPLRREDILIPFAKALGTSMYEGRVKGKGVMGFFRPKVEEVRIRRHADLETAAHELAHLIDKRVPEVRKAWISGPDWQKHRAELKGLSYDASKVYEGFAEFVRHYMTQPDIARERAPTFSRWFDDFVQRHEYGPAVLKAREGMTAWFAQDAVDRARSKIGAHEPMSKAMDERWDAFRQATVDDLHGIYRMEREMGGGKLLPNGPYESARLSRASASIADGAIRFGAPVKNPDGSYGWKGKGLEDILKPVAENLDDALLYFVGRSARELMAQGREHLFTAGEIDGMLKLRRPEFDKAFKEYQAWNAAVLDFAEAHGVINPAARALWQRMEYLPFHRVGQPEGYRAKPGDWSGVKALTGGTENIRDVLGNMTSNAAMLIDKAVKNEARQKIADLAAKDGGGRFMVQIPPESRPVKIEKQAVVDAVLKALGIERGDPASAGARNRIAKALESAPAMLDLIQTNMPPAGGNVVAVLRGGKPVWYEVGDPLLLRALEAIDRQPPPWIVHWLGLPKRVGQLTITMTPDFMAANLARDTIQGAVMSRAGFRPVLDSLQGMRLRLTNDPLYKEFIANGGGLSSIFLDESNFRARLERFYGRQGIDYRTVLDAPHKLLNFVEHLADAVESSTRLGEYRRAIQAGEHPRHAAYLGREVSTDFAMRGDSKALGFMYDTVMFLKAATVSWDRMLRGASHDPNRGAIATKAGILAGVSAALYLLNKDDPRYQDLPDWDKDTHWHFFIGDEHFRYPKIWEVGALASMAERTVEKTMAGDPEGLGKDFARVLSSTFGLNWMPQVIAPLYEQGANRNSFTKAPIETPGMENMQPFMRAKPTTSETLKAAGMATRDMPEALQVNPVRAEALLRGYFNTWAMYGLMLSDQAFFGDQLPEMRTDQLPVVRRFYAEEPARQTRYETQFYEMLGEARRLRGTLRELDKTGRPEIADEKEREPMATEAKPLERASDSLQAINQEMRAVRRAPELTPADKRAKLDALTAERNNLLKRTVKEAEAAQKARREEVGR